MVIVAIVAIVLWKVGGPGTSGNIGQEPAGGAAADGAITREDVSADTEVPGLDSETPDNVARPTIVTPVVPGSDSSVRAFDMKIENGAFNPDTVIVQVNDVANVKIMAVDQSYSIVQPDYGFSLTIPKGETKVFAGQFTSPGKYLLYCPSCGGPDKGPKGYVVAVPKQ